MAHTLTRSHTQSIAHHLVKPAIAIGQFLYGDEQRTRRSLLFAFTCITLYTAAFFHASVNSCTGVN